MGGWVGGWVGFYLAWNDAAEAGNKPLQEDPRAFLRTDLHGAVECVFVLGGVQPLHPGFDHVCRDVGGWVGGLER